MSRTVLPFFVGDISALAKSLRAGLIAGESAPGHLELLNLLARAAGCRNFQHFRANALAKELLAAASPVAPDPVDFGRVAAMARLFDDAGLLVRWPSKRNLQLLCLWAFWAQIAPRRPYDEREITEILAARHHFGDAALLRRELCDQGLLRRTRDCREYRRIEQRPPADARELLRLLRETRTDAVPVFSQAENTAGRGGRS